MITARAPLALSLFLAQLLLGAPPKSSVQPSKSPPEAVSSKARVQNIYALTPLSFEVNAGQVSDANVKFVARGRSHRVLLTPGGITLALTPPAGAAPVAGQPHVAPPEMASATKYLRIKLEGADPNSRMQAIEQLPGKVNYLIGNDRAKWQRNVTTYARVEYSHVYPGVDLICYGNQRRLEYDFVVAPGADPGQISLALEGADDVHLDSGGDLVVRAGDQEVRNHKPVIYQFIDGNRRQIQGAYQLKSDHRVAFQVASYDTSKPLIIDPVLEYSTYLGSTGQDLGFGIAVDTSGNAYVTGESTLGNAFVTKFNSAGVVQYSTEIGGSGYDYGSAIAVDSLGSAYITGQTVSTDFPLANALRSSFGGAAYLAFVTKLNAAGDDELFSTYLGGDTDYGTAIAVDSTANIYVGGQTVNGSFPTHSAFQSSRISYYDSFVTKIKSDYSGFVFSTYLGGTGDDYGVWGIATDTAGNTYVTGNTQSSNFPVTAGAFQTAIGGGQDAHVTQFGPTGTLIYSTFLGGTGNETASDIAVDASGNAYVTGNTSSTNFPAPVAPASPPYQSSNAGGEDIYIAAINATGTGLLYSTYLGGTGNDSAGAGNSIALDGNGNVYVVGSTASSNFPLVAPTQLAFGGAPLDAVVARLNGSLSALTFSTYLGGGCASPPCSPAQGDDRGHGIAVDGAGHAYVIGYTNSSANFPLANAAQDTYAGGNYDAFVAKFTNDAPTASAVNITGTPNVGETLTGNYTYGDSEYDEEGGTTFRWLRGTTEVGTSQTYVVVTADEGQSITFEVTPVALTGTTPGLAVTSTGVTINSAPTATGVGITGLPNVGQLLTGVYTYFDVNGDLEGASTLQWFRGATLVATSPTYTSVPADIGQTITFQVTPAALTGTTPGIMVESPPVTIVAAPVITSAGATTFTTGSSGSFTVTGTGYPAPTFTKTGALPSGVSLSAAGLLAGTPKNSTGGTYNITITASNGVTPNAVQPFTLTVLQPASITSANKTGFFVGKAGSFTVRAAGFPVPTLELAAGTLPAGVTFTPGAGTGVLSGTPAAGTKGTYVLTFSATNGVGTPASQTFTLTVK